MLSFVHPWFLLALAGLAVPVALHLMERERPLERVFPSVRFIRPAGLPQEGGRRRLRDLFLLLLRLLFMAALILAFARPVWRFRGAGGGSGAGAVPTVFLLDLSASMNVARAVPTARARIESWLRTHPGQPAGLVASKGRSVETVPLSADHSGLRAALSKLAPGLSRGRHAAALGQAVAMLRAVPAGRLVVFSDFQETDWQDAALRSPGPGIGLDLVNVDPDYTRNVGVLRATARLLGHRKVRVTVSMQNYGFQVETRTVEVRIGSARSSVRAEIAPGAVVRKTFVLPKTDSTVGTATLDPDAYTPDDRFVFWSGPVPAVPILIAAPFETEPAKRAEMFFLRKALEAVPEGGIAEFKVEAVDVSQFFALNLEAADAVFLLGALERFQTAELQMLRQYLDNGGTVFCTPGAGTALLFKVLQTSGLASLEFRGIVGQHRRADALPFTLGWVDPESPVGRLFSGERQTDLFLFAVRRYARFKAGPGVHVILKTEQGDPALVEAAVGRGRLFVSAFAFEPGWSDFPLSASFLPFLRELLADGTGEGRSRIRRLECGARAALPSTLLGEQPPAGRRKDARIDTDRPGAFSVQGIPFEVNVSRLESTVRRAELDVLRARWAAGVAPSGRTAVSGEASRGSASLRRGREFRGLLAWAAAVFFLLEMVVAGLPRAAGGGGKTGH
ncbi:MAG: VWA domain-containing protein [Kiritimatiellaeota bacterium]|nr:VWA domain-containing protein [Kiritimatiellota bacterium]